jgi:hypothetical protein
MSVKSPDAGSLTISFSRPSGSVSRLITTLPSCICGWAVMRGTPAPRHSNSSTGAHCRLSADR